VKGFGCGMETAPAKGMTTSGSAPNRKTEEVAPDRWTPFLAEFTRENRGAHARLTIIGADADLGVQVEIENRPLDGVSADMKDGERTVWISFGSAASDHATHGVPRATAIRTLAAVIGGGTVLEVESADGTKTLLELASERYELPAR
jgi:hypothetical protein